MRLFLYIKFNHVSLIELVHGTILKFVFMEEVLFAAIYINEAVILIIFKRVYTADHIHSSDQIIGKYIKSVYKTIHKSNNYYNTVRQILQDCQYWFDY